MNADEYVRSVGFTTSVRTAQVRLAWVEDKAAVVEEVLAMLDTSFAEWGYGRRACLSLALYATRGLLAVIRFDLQRIGEEEGRES